MDQHLNTLSVIDTDDVSKVKEILVNRLNSIAGEQPVQPTEAELVNNENIERYKILSEFLADLQSACDEKIAKGEPSEHLDLLSAFCWAFCQQVGITPESLTEEGKFFDNLKKKYQKLNSGKIKGLLPSVAVLGADAVSPGLGKLVQFIFSNNK